MPYVGHNERLRKQNERAQRGTHYGISGAASIGGRAPWVPGSSGATGSTGGGGIRQRPEPVRQAPVMSPEFEARRSALVLDNIDKYMQAGLTYEQAAARVAKNLMASGTVSTKDLESTMKKYVHAAYGTTFNSPSGASGRRQYEARHPAGPPTPQPQAGPPMPPPMAQAQSPAPGGQQPAFPGSPAPGQRPEDIYPAPWTGDPVNPAAAMANNPQLPFNIAHPPTPPPGPQPSRFLSQAPGQNYSLNPASLGGHGFTPTNTYSHGMRDAVGTGHGTDEDGDMALHGLLGGIGTAAPFVGGAVGGPPGAAIGVGLGGLIDLADLLR